MLAHEIYELFRQVSVLVQLVYPEFSNYNNNQIVV